MSQKSKTTKRAALRRQIAMYDPHRLWALINAAASSPTTRERWQTFGYLANAALKSERSGHKAPRHSHLPSLAEMVTIESPQIRFTEDFTPNDPRQRVLVRLGDDVLRLFPGQVERPVADVDRALLVADATDDVLIERKGFGIRHILDVGLRYVDQAIRVLEPSWTDGAKRDDTYVSAAEFTTATLLVESGTPESIPCSEEHRRALEWATCTTAELPYRFDHSNSAFGRYFRVQRDEIGQQLVWLPLAFLPEAIGFAVAALAAEADRLSPNALQRFDQLSAARVRRALWRFTPTVLGPPDLDDGPASSPMNVVQWVARTGSAHVVTVQVESALSGCRLPSKPAALASANSPASTASPVRIPLPVGGISFEPDTEIVPMMVVSNSGHVAVPFADFAAISFDDLRWIAPSATDDTDLFLFCRDMISAGSSVLPIMAFEGIDRWEWWSSNGKSLSRSGATPSFMTIAPHHGNAEWDLTAGRSDLEIALATLGMFALRDADAVESERSGPVSVYRYEELPPRQRNPLGVFDGMHHRPDLQGWSIHIGAVPVAVQITDVTWCPTAFPILHDLAGSLAFGLRQIAEEWDLAHETSNIVGYLFELTPADDTEYPDEAAIWLKDAAVVSGPSGTLCHANLIVRAKPLVEMAVDDIQAAHRVVASAIGSIVRSAGLGEVNVNSVVQAWAREKPTLVANMIPTPTSRPNLSSPIKLHEGPKSAADRTISQQIHQANVEPGEYRGDSARNLENDVIAPTALRLLNDRLRSYNMEDLVHYGAVQLERCVARQSEDPRQLSDAAKHLNVEWDPFERHSELSAEYLTLRRCIETAIEACLRLGPQGSGVIDKVAWIEILAASQSYLESTTRSEQLNHQMNPTSLEVSEMYEMSVRPDKSGTASSAAAGSGKVYDLDWNALVHARAAEDLTPPSADPKAPSQPFDPLVDVRLDAAMLAEYGASGSDVLAVLFALASWPLLEADSDVATTQRCTVIEHLIESTVFGGEDDGHERIGSAVELLTSTSTALRESSWRPWQARSRQRRLLVQPLIDIGGENIIVAPQFCLSSLSVYRRYFDQGQLPWSQPTPPKAVDTALASIRQSRNVALEKHVSQVMRGNGWSVIENVKENKPRRLNVPSLSTEIDAVAGRSGSPTIWLLEVKDPAETFVTADTRRMLDSFYVDAKKKAYATQLQRKFDDLAPHAPSVAAALGLDARPDNDPYVVKPLFVTRTPVAAAYIGGPFGFVPIKELANFVDDGDMGTTA